MNKKISGGMSFLTSVSFHDAKLVDVRYGEKYGKECFLLLVDFKTAEAPPVDGSLYEISFLEGKFVQEPKRKRDCYILAFDCSPAGQNMRARIESEYFVGGEAHHEILEIEFSDVEVFLREK